MADIKNPATIEGKTISVFSNKGGVGKTFVAVNLACALAITGKKVLLLDMDIQGGDDMATMLGLDPKNSLAQMLSNFRDFIPTGPENFKVSLNTHSSGLDFLPAVMNTDEVSALSHSGLRTLLRAVSQSYDYTIIDLGLSFNEIMLAALDLSKVIFLVATPDVLAVYQLRWCLKILEEIHFPLKMVKVVLNRAESQGGVAWQEVRNALAIDIIGRIPSDGVGVGTALDHGVPVIVDSPKGIVAEAFRKIVSDIVKGDMFFHSSEAKRLLKMDRFDESKKFFERLKKDQAQPAEPEDEISEPSTPAPETSKEDMLALKKDLQAKLIAKLHLESLTPEHFTDVNKSRELRDSAKKIVSSLLFEERPTLFSSHEERKKIISSIINETFGLGVLEEIMEDPDVSDIMVNSSQEIYIEKKGEMILTDYKFVSDQQLRAIINRIIAPLSRRIDESTPLVDARLQDGSRFNAIIPPLCLTGPAVTIRKFGVDKLTVNDIVDRFGSLSTPMMDFLHACVLGRMNIIISGGTGSGKTTLLNVLSEFIPDTERIITIEDAAELHLRKEHWCRLESRPPNIEGAGSITLRDLFVNSLRMRPDRIVIGECRGPEILDMLQAMNTGHDGSMTTLHANSSRDVLIRVSSMILLSGIELPVRAINEMISSAINIIVQMARFPDGTRKTTCITEIAGISDKHELILKDIFTYKQTGQDSTGKVLGSYQNCQYVPKCAEAIIVKGIPLDKSMFTAKA